MPFGSGFATRATDPSALRAQLATVATGLRECSVPRPDAAFESQVCLLSIGSMRLASVAHTGFQLDVADSPDLLFMFPFDGILQVRSAGQSLVAMADAHGVLLPGQAFRANAAAGSTMLVSVDAAGLEATARQMLGLVADDPLGLPIQRPALIDLDHSGIPFGPILRHLCASIDVVSGRSYLLRLQGLDEALMRNFVLMLAGDRLALDAGASATVARHPLDKVCQYILTHLHGRITVNELAQAGAMSERALQYAFRDRFQCTPMQWVKHQRLLEARRLLRQADDRESVARIALACGFVNLGAFAVEYRRTFGERPSETLRTGTLNRPRSPPRTTPSPEG